MAAGWTDFGARTDPGSVPSLRIALHGMQQGDAG
jgi:hypothetical protein